MTMTNSFFQFPKKVMESVRGKAEQEVPMSLDPTWVPGSEEPENITGAKDADFVALGLGGTGMMAMIWSVAMGKRAVGVELRGDPALGVHWNIREDLYHHFGLIDELMLARYGEEGVPRRDDGRLFSLRDTFYTPHTEPGGVYTDEIITGFLSSLGYEQHIGGLIDHTEFIDDRWVNGEAKRHVTVLTPPRVPEGHRKEMVGRPISEVLDGPSTFQVGASEALVLLRRYLEKIEEMDLAKGIEPRVRMFTSHRVVTGTTSGSPDETSYVEWMTQDDGFVKQNDGRMQIRIEAIRELDYRGRFRRIRVPGTEVIDLGVPELFMIAQGFYSSDAERLGFEQEDIEVDHHDGRGPVVAQADYLAGLIEIHVGARLRRRIASEFDSEGNEYWVRQLAVGHEDDPEVGWILVQVPDFKTFDPVLAGLVPEGTDPNSKLYSGAYHHMLRDFYLEQVSLVTEIPRDKLEELQMPYGPKMFSLVERMGADSKVTENGIVAGDSFGNGHFLTSGGAITGMVGHACRVLEYWQAREAGASASDALRKLADAVRDDTEGWMHVSAQEFSRSAPINFGDERIAEIAKSSGRTGEDRAKTIDATRRHRHGLVPLNPSDWRRLLIRAGKLHAQALPPLEDTHPAHRSMLSMSDVQSMPKAESCDSAKASPTTEASQTSASSDAAQPCDAAKMQDMPEEGQMQQEMASMHQQDKPAPEAVC